MPLRISALCACLLIALAAVMFFTEKPREISLPGHVTVYLKDKGEIITEEYCDFLTGCVFGLIPPESEREAIKSAVCALNTLAVYRMAENSGFANNGADITAEENGEFPYMSEAEVRERYGASAERYISRVRECTEKAMRYIITYEEAPIYAQMCLISSGKTDSGAFPYLTGVSAECDTEADGWESSTALTPKAVRATLGGIAGKPHLVGNGGEWFSEPQYADTGTLTSILFGGKKISGKQLKDALGLRSAAITVSYAEDKFLFVCRGCGDNVGMSLSCAQTFALQGMKMTDILAYFYKDTVLTAARTG